MGTMNLPDLYRGSNLPLATDGPGLPGAPGADAAADRLDLRVLFGIFRRRLPLFLAIVGGFAALAVLYTLTQPNLYRASADVVINKDLGEIVPSAAAASPDAPMRSEEIDTELKIIRSQELADRVISRLRLDQDPQLRQVILDNSGLVARLKRAVGIGAADPSGNDLQRRLADALIGNLKAERMETAYAIRISFTSRNPVQAARIANAFAESYASRAVEAKRAENEKTLAQLRSRIDELRSQAQVDFGAVQDFRVANGLLSSQATQLSEQDAAAYSQQLAAARAMAAVEQGRASNAGGTAAAAAVSSPLVSSLRSQRAAISVKVADLSGRYHETHPDLITARRELADIDRQILVEVGRVSSGVSAGLASTARATSQQVGALQGNLAGAQARLAENNRALVGLDDLSRKAQASQALYESYLSRYKEVLAQAGTERPEAQLLSAAKAPGAPISPNLPLNLALGLVIGALLGTGAAIAAETSFSGLTTGEDVERRLGMRYFGGVPLLSSVDVHADWPADSLASHPSSAYAEAIRGLIAATRQGPGKRHQVFAVGSALPSEGKTTVAMSLVRSAALSGEAAIIIDCDLTRRSLSKTCGADMTRPGLREMMHDGVKLGDAMIADPHSPAMILPITTAFGKGEGLLDQGRFHRMIAMMREHFAVIVLDTPPILAIAESRKIVTLADDLIVTTWWRKTSDSAVIAALKMLPLNVLPNVGIALNAIDMKKQAKFGVGDATYYYDEYKSYYVDA